MQKAQLSNAQRGHSLIAGATANILFSTGWFLLGFVLLGGGIALVVGGTAKRASGLFEQIPQLNDLIARSGDIVGFAIVAIGILSLVFIALAAVVSGFVLKRGRVRKPWAVTFQSLGIVALLDIPLFLGFFAVAAAFSDSATSIILVIEPLIRLIGSALVGALVWWLVAWMRRGSASKFAGVTATASSIAVEAPAQLDTPTETETDDQPR